MHRAALPLLFVLLAAWNPAPPAGGEEAARPAFVPWLEGVRQEARGAGIREETLVAALAGLEPIERVVELDRSQPEVKLSLREYLGRVVPRSRVEAGRRKLAEHRELLERVRARYGVQPRFLVAFWGIESDFGRLTGGFPVVAATATLAWEGRRAAYFRKELLNVLHILDQGHVPAEKMKGSWAGAMGQLQFMPSTFRRHAVDFDGDGRADIWGSLPDVFASAAKYLVAAGWQGDQTWGREVRLPAGFEGNLLGLETVKGLEEWQRLGVRRADGTELPRRDLPASLVQPEGPGGRAFAVYANYRAILDWNRSHKFALAVGTLADRIGGR